MVLGFVLHHDFFSAPFFWCRILWGLFEIFIAAFVCGLIGYKLEKTKSLESFENCFFALSYYMNSIKYESSVEEYLWWYRISSRLVKKLEQSYSQIGYLWGCFDIFMRKEYFKGIVEYCYYFMKTVEKDFELLEKTGSESDRKTVADKIFLKVKEGKTGQEYIGNKLNQTLVTQMKIVTKICSGKYRRIESFHELYVPIDVMQNLSKDEEKIVCKWIKKFNATSYEINGISASEESLRSLKKKNYIKEYQKYKEGKYKVTGNKILPLYMEIKKKERYVDAKKHRDFIFSLFSIVICCISLIEFIVSFVEKGLCIPQYISDKVDIGISILAMISLFIVDVRCERIWTRASKKVFKGINKLDELCVGLSIVLFVGTDFMMKFFSVEVLFIMLLVIVFFIVCGFYGVYKSFQDEM
jgi:membrane protein